MSTNIQKSIENRRIQTKLILYNGRECLGKHIRENSYIAIMVGTECLGKHITEGWGWGQVFKRSAICIFVWINFFFYQTTR